MHALVIGWVGEEVGDGKGGERDGGPVAFVADCMGDMLQHKPLQCQNQRGINDGELCSTSSSETRGDRLFTLAGVERHEKFAKCRAK